MNKSITHTLTLVATLGIVAALGACGKKDEAPSAKPAGAAAPVAPAGPPKGLPVRAEQVKIGEVASQVTAVGTILAEESVIIRPEIDGRITGLHFNEGQAVQKGTKLVTLDAAEYEAQMASSESQARTARQRYERTTELFAQKFVSQDALDVARNELKRAEARVREDKVRVDRASIHAPFSGVVGVRMISPGAYVKKGDDIVRLENISSLKLDFRVPEHYLSKLKAGQEVDIRVDAYPDRPFSGKIYAIEPVVDEKTRTILLRARIPNDSSKLRPGMFARVNVLLERRLNAVLVPEQAIWPQGQEAFVFKVVDGKAVLTKIKLGERRPGEVEVVAGLDPKAVVITDGQIKIKDGAPVTVLPSTPPAAAAGGDGSVGKQGS